MNACLSDPVTAAAGGVLTIDLGALRHNYACLARAAAPARCAAVVKADAYGLGAARVAPAFHAAGCRFFFVAHLAEGLALRPLVPHDATIAVLNGLQPGGEAPCAAAGLVPVLNGLDQVDAWADTCRAAGRRLPAILQVDSGMARLGLSPAEVDALLARDDGLAAMEVILVMSHLACADEPDSPANAAQRDRFAALRARLPGGGASLSNSGGLLLGPRFGHDLARPGVALYGVEPTPGRQLGVRPVVSLQARVIQVRQVPAGTAVGYGGTFVTPRPARLATVAVGYADGWPRHLSNRGGAAVDGVRLPIAGRVSMDSMTLDASALPEGRLRLGTLVELIGPHRSLAEVAAEADTIPYEILTGLGHRYARRYRDGAGPTTSSPSEPA